MYCSRGAGPRLSLRSVSVAGRYGTAALGAFSSTRERSAIVAGRRTPCLPAYPRFEWISPPPKQLINSTTAPRAAISSRAARPTPGVRP